jgi:hypothetical protein
MSKLLLPGKKVQVVLKEITVLVRQDGQGVTPAGSFGEEKEKVGVTQVWPSWRKPGLRGE